MAGACTTLSVKEVDPMVCFSMETVFGYSLVIENGSVLRGRSM